MATNTAALDPDELDPNKKPFWKPAELHRLGFGHHTAVLHTIEAGDIQAVRIGRKRLIPTNWIRQQMQLPELPTGKD